MLYGNVKKNSEQMRAVHDDWVDILDVDIKDIVNYIKSNPLSIIDGGILNEFEKAFANFIGTKFAVAFCNGTAALHAASFACGANKNSKFILSEYSYFGTVNSVLENNSKVTLCDYDPNTLGIDVESAEKCLDENTVGLIITHCFGNPVDMDSVAKLKKKHAIKIISDASHAHGAKWRNKIVGNSSCEDIACFSLGKDKLISCGELGVAVTNDALLYDSLLFMGHVNRVPKAFITTQYSGYQNCLGNKYRPHTLSMVLALNQIKRFHEKKIKNINTNEYLIDKIAQIPGFNSCKAYQHSERVYWKLIITLDKNYWGNIDFKNVVNALKEEGMPLEQWHNYNIKAHEYVWRHERYNGLVQNKSSMGSPSNIIILPGYIDLSKKNMDLMINCFTKISENKKKIL